MSQDATPLVLLLRLSQYDRVSSAFPPSRPEDLLIGVA